MCDSSVDQYQLPQNGVDGAALREHHQPFLFTDSSSLAFCAVSLVECWHCCFFMSTGQLHTCQRVPQHAVTKWQCWWCCSDAELICSSSCICSISIPDRRNVIVLSPTQGGCQVPRNLLPTHVAFRKAIGRQNASAHQIPSWPKYRESFELIRALEIFDHKIRKLKTKYQIWQPEAKCTYQKPPQTTVCGWRRSTCRTSSR